MADNTRGATGGAGIVTGIFNMGAGTLTVTNMFVGDNPATVGSSIACTGTFTVSGTANANTGGTANLAITTLEIGSDDNTSDTVSGTINLGATASGSTITGGSNTGTVLQATTIESGTFNDGPSNTTRAFNWYDGTIENISGAPLTISAGPTWTLENSSSGTHALDVTAGQTASVAAALGGGGGLTIGNLSGFTGTVVLSAANTYTGPTTISAGTLALASSGSLGNTAVKVGSTTSSGTLQVNGNFTIGTASAGTGTVAVGGTSGIGTLTFPNSESGVSILTVKNATATNTAITLGGSTSGAAVLNFNYNASGTDTITTGAKLVMGAGNGGATINLSALSGSPLAANTYNLISFATSTVPSGIVLARQPHQCSNRRRGAC